MEKNLRKSLARLDFITHIESPNHKEHMYKGKTLERIIWNVSDDILPKNDKLFFVQAVCHYPALPSIEDTFTSHSERRDRTRKLPQRKREAVGANSLRHSACSNLVEIAALTIEESIPEIHSLYEKKIEQFRLLLTEYNDWDNARKKKLNAQLRKFAKSVCISISKLKR